MERGHELYKRDRNYAFPLQLLVDALEDLSYRHRLAAKQANMPIAAGETAEDCMCSAAYESTFKLECGPTHTEVILRSVHAHGGVHVNLAMSRAALAGPFAMCM